MKIDAHNHFWRYNALAYPWINDRMSVLQKDFLPETFAALLKDAGIEGCIAVQARQTLEETRWLLSLAQQYDFIKGVVGWIDLQSENLLEQQLEGLRGEHKLKGFRHVLHDEPDDRFMLRPEFIRGLRTLADYGYSYDILIFQRHLFYALELIERLPAMPLVIDHIAKPDLSNWQPWADGIRAAAQFPHVYCKLSGLVTEADWRHWQSDDFNRHLEHVFACFGPERVMYGSDWPVCTVAADYPQVHQLIRDFVSRYCPDNAEQIFGGTAAAFYTV